MKFKIRASALGQIMTNPRLKKDKEAGNLSDTAKQYVREWYISQKYGRRKIVATKPMLKGNEVEEDSIALLEKYRKIKGLYKNEQTFEDDHFTGTPDLIYQGEVIDIKSAYDLFTFHKGEGPKTATSYSLYGWQLQCYMALTDCKTSSLARVLVDSPDWIINDEVHKAKYKFDLSDPDIEEYFNDHIEPQLIANHKPSGFNYKGKDFPAIPLEDRVLEWDLARDDDAIDQARERVERINWIINNDLDSLWKG